MYIFGKVYNVIIGGGSWGNVVVDIMVDKLILKLLITCILTTCLGCKREMR
jgi:hypothetical protein